MCRQLLLATYETNDRFARANAVEEPNYQPYTQAHYRDAIRDTSKIIPAERHLLNLARRVKLIRMHGIHIESVHLQSQLVGLQLLFTHHYRQRGNIV